MNDKNKKGGCDTEHCGCGCSGCGSHGREETYEDDCDSDCECNDGLSLYKALTDDDNDDDIVMVDEDGKEVVMEQLGIVTLRDNLYAILHAVDDADDEALVFLINPDDEESISLVEDDKLGEEIITAFNDRLEAEDAAEHAGQHAGAHKCDCAKCGTADKSGKGCGARSGAAKKEPAKKNTAEKKSPSKSKK
jgi:hypothetical protein